MENHVASPEIVKINEVEQASKEAFTDSAVELLAQRLAGTYILSQQVTGDSVLLHLLQRQEKLLKQAYQHFSSAIQEDLTPSTAAEWLLDNFFVVQQTIRQIREDMPAGYYQQLPKLKNTLLEHYPRIYALAHEA